MTIPKRLRPFMLTAILLVIASALAALLAGEWVYLKNRRAQTFKTEHPAQTPLPEAALLPDAFALPNSDKYEQIVSRPLFMESRRPGQPPSTEPPPPPPPTAPPPISLKLMGVLSTPKGKVALIADAKGKYKRLKLRDALDGWQVVGIKPDRLFLEQNGFKEDLPLLKKKEKTAPGRQPQAPNPSAQPPQALAPPQPQPPQTEVGGGRYPPRQPVPDGETMHNNSGEPPSGLEEDTEGEDLGDG